jgi:hypothetical protein
MQRLPSIPTIAMRAEPSSFLNVPKLAYAIPEDEN